MLKDLDRLILDSLYANLSKDDEITLIEILNNPEMKNEVMSFLRLEVALLSENPSIGIHEKIINKIENVNSNKLKQNIMNEIKKESIIHYSKKNKFNIINLKFFKLAFAASIAIIATVLLFSMPSNIVGKVVLSSKGATIIRDNRILSPENFSNLKIGDIIETKDDFSMAYEDNTLIDIKKNSKIIVQGTSSEKKLYLEKGAIFATVKPQDKNNPFIIVTPNGNVEVIGTAFYLQTSKNQTKIRVKKGKVKFGKEKSMILTAGEVASFTKDKLNYYGLMSNEDYLNIDNPILFNLDFSKEMPQEVRFHGEIEPFGHAGQKVAVSKPASGHTGVFYYSPNNPLISLSADMVLHVTLKTNTIDGPFELGLLNTTSPIAQRQERFYIPLRKWLEKDKLNKWQTISLPVKKGKIDKNNKETYIMKEKFGTNQHLFLVKYIRLAINGCKDGQLLIDRVWITK